tara:strand:- start:51356 stop:52105 length:750 start_codon:yes stop_codon:yes gene_type:complete
MIFRLGLMAAMLFTLVSVSPFSLAQADTLTDDQRKEIESLVEKYILDNPGIVMRAIEKLREQQRQAEEQQRMSAISGSGNDLRSDPITPPGGNPDGEVTVVEFFDYNCGYCKRVSPTVAALIEGNRDVKVIYKEFPILGDASIEAAKGAMAAVRQGKYHEMHEGLMNHRGRVTAATVMSVAKDLGLDTEQLDRDMKDPEIQSAIERNYALAQNLGITGTPAFVIGNKLVPGAASLETLEELVKEVRKGS